MQKQQYQSIIDHIQTEKHALIQEVDDFEQTKRMLTSLQKKYDNLEEIRQDWESERI